MLNMLNCTLRRICSRAASLTVINRYIKTIQHVNFNCSDAMTVKINQLQKDKQLDFNCSDAMTVKINQLQKDKQLENIKLNDLLDSSIPKPFEEIPLYKDASEIDFHPAEFIDNMGLPLPISFNLAAYVNHSETLIKLVQLGVDVSEFDNCPEKAKYILTLDFEKDIKQYIQFLYDHGVKSDDLGRCITKNPFVFKEDLDNLEIRINYLQSKNFSTEAIGGIITKNPFVLSMSTKHVDSRLGYFQKQFDLSGDEVRHIMTRCPKLISLSYKKCMEKRFIFKEVFGFNSKEIKAILVRSPKVWMLGPRVLKERFDVVHKAMDIPQEIIVQFPGVLQKRTFLLKERHEYLVHLNRAQYDPTKPNYVSLYDIATTIDSVFCERCAHTSVEKYNEFLKTR